MRALKLRMRGDEGECNWFNGRGYKPARKKPTETRIAAFCSKKNRPSSLHSGRDSKAQASEPDSTLVSGLRKPKYVQVFSGFAMSHLHSLVLPPGRL